MNSVLSNPDKEKMTSQAGRTSQKQGQNGQLQKKMFNNFLDSLDISANQQTNTSTNLANGYSRTKSQNTTQGGKMSSSTHAIRMSHNNTIQGGSMQAAKRNKQLVSTSYNMGPTQLMQ